MEIGIQQPHFEGDSETVTKALQMGTMGWGGNLCLWIKYREAKSKLNDGHLRWCLKAFGMMISLSKQKTNAALGQNNDKSSNWRDQNLFLMGSNFHLGCSSFY